MFSPVLGRYDVSNNDVSNVIFFSKGSESLSNQIRSFPPTSTCRAGDSAAGPAPEPRPQAVGKDDAGADGAEREAAAHAADVLQRQPEAGRADEGAAGRDDGPEPAGDPRVVPEQALQRQEEVHPDEAAPAAAAQR